MLRPDQLGKRKHLQGEGTRAYTNNSKDCGTNEIIETTTNIWPITERIIENQALNKSSFGYVYIVVMGTNEAPSIKDLIKVKNVVQKAEGRRQTDLLHQHRQK
ncbi:hypothetical protein Zmor_015565 [Zophobas morio]|uniref:Uncharacterized protein n=1 Tax=Zophobas morio TaxID=2755281 RepID=A0AA38IGZ1_9CUCU|nr:hypothetical protein Zmor_015565 [Zophobas morio]